MPSLIDGYDYWVACRNGTSDAKKQRVNADRERTVPTSTYRVQLSDRFTLDDLAAQVPYIARLGISHVYLSPIYAARPGSPPTSTRMFWNFAGKPSIGIVDAGRRDRYDRKVPEPIGSPPRFRLFGSVCTSGEGPGLQNQRGV